jgi:hypothetical protein
VRAWVTLDLPLAAKAQMLIDSTATHQGGASISAEPHAWCGYSISDAAHLRPGKTPVNSTQEPFSVNRGWPVVASSR